MSNDLARLDAARWLVRVLGCVALPLAACADDATAVDEDSGSSSSSGAPTTTLGTSVGTDGTGTTSPAETSTGVDPDTTGTGDSSGASDESSGSVSAESSSSTSPESGSESGVIAMCPAGELGPGIPETLFGNTFAELDDFAGSCGGDAAPDLGYVFTAPADGFYTFDTHGSQLDTVIYVLDGECAGAEIACDDDGDGNQSVVAVQLVADQTVTVIVDGNDAVGQPFSLRVQQGSLVCPLLDLGNTVPTVISGSGSGLFNEQSGSCGGGGGRDASYLFTAPAAGTYTFDTFDSTFVSALYVLDGNCTGPEISCGHEGILVDLAAGQQVTAVVDSVPANGDFDLRIDALGGACPNLDLGNLVPQNIVGDTTTSDNTDSGSCGGDFSPDDLYEFTAPVDGLYSFDTFGSALDTVLYLLDGGCGGPELECNDDFTMMNDESRIIEGLAAGQTVMIGVDGNGSGAYDLLVDIVPCPDDALPGTVPDTVADNTTGGIDKLHGSCSSAGPLDESPDFAYSFTAPADGAYTFDTIGSAYDTLLYLLDGAACNGAELACNDNYQFSASSAVSVQLLADQTVTVVVDGNFNSQGNFTLNVGQLTGTCPDSDLGNTIPTMVADTTMGGDNAAGASCGGLAGNDISYTWAAPADALYIFDTEGSSFDTIVYVQDGNCNGAELDCSAQFGGQSLAFAQLLQDQVVVVTVDGDGQEGDFNLLIDEAPPGGDCCIIHDEPGCAVPDIEECVCNLDGFCCDTSWDSLCVDEAVDFCGALCP